MSDTAKDTAARNEAPALLPTVTSPPRPLAVRLATIARCLVFLTIVALLASAYIGKEILAPALLAVLAALLLSPIVGVFDRIGLPRAAGSFLTVLFVVAVAGFCVVALSAPAKDFAAKAPTLLKNASQKMREVMKPMQQAAQVTESLDVLAPQKAPDAQQVVVKTDSGSMLGSVVSVAPHMLETVVATLLLVYFFLSSGDNFLRRLVEIAPGLKEKRIVVTIARDIEHEMSRYLLTITVINFGLGVATAIALWLLGVPSALFFGALVFVFNFAPYVGAAICAITFLVVGLTTFPTIGHAMAVPATFLLLGFIEGQLITPTVLGKRLAVNPVVVFLWLLVWGWLWGIVGLLLAGPLLACFRILCKHIEALRPIYILIGEAKLEHNGNDGHDAAKARAPA